jgi:hypothetical protein
MEVTGMEMAGKRWMAGLVLGGALGLGGPATAADFTWQMNSGTNCKSSDIGGAAPCNWDNTRMFGASPGTGPSVTASAWAFTGDNGGTNTLLQSAYLSVYGGGLGGINQDRGSGPGQDLNEGSDPEHAIDSNQRYELVKLEFGGSTPIALKRAQVNYVSSDSDISVFYYPTALGAPPPLEGKDLVGDGWELLGHYDGDGSANNVYNFNAGGAIASQHWLISSYLPSFANASCTTCTGGNDKFKLFSAGGSTPNGKVPEPATALLLAVAMGGLLTLARRRRMA